MMTIVRSTSVTNGTAIPNATGREQAGETAAPERSRAGAKA